PSPSRRPRSPVRLQRVLGALVLALTLFSEPVPAQTPEERIAFDAAVRAFNDGFAEKAADDLAAFLRDHPTSPLAAEATLLEARARAKTGQLEAAAGLLTSRLDSLTDLKDQALYLL